MISGNMGSLTVDETDLGGGGGGGHSLGHAYVFQTAGVIGALSSDCIHPKGWDSPPA